MVILMNEIINVKSQLKISLPIAFESLINILMTLVDTLVISMVGTTELAALGAMSVASSFPPQLKTARSVQSRAYAKIAFRNSPCNFREVRKS